MPQAIHPPPVPLNFLYCDQPHLFAVAIHKLRDAPYVILDCEGVNLGREGGSVTLICVGTPFAEHIFLFDVLSPLITYSDMEGLLYLLNDSNILKIVWDGRMDYLEIWSTYGVPLQGILDLQVAEVMSRYTVRGEGEDARIRRLRGQLSVSTTMKKRYEGLHAVVGLQRCWKECGYEAESGKDPEIMRMHKVLGSSVWAARPLTHQLLQYAARDILLIGVLYPHFCRSGWIPRQPLTFGALLSQCQRYVSAHVEQGKSADSDVFRPCGIIPLDVLTIPHKPKFVCFACNRSLSASAFETQSTRPLSETSPISPLTPLSPEPMLRSTKCRLCFSLAVKKNGHADQTWLHM